MKKTLVVFSILFLCVLSYAGGSFPTVQISDNVGTAIVGVNASGELKTVVGAGTSNIGDVDVLSVVSSSTTAKVEAYLNDGGGTITVADTRYEQKTSTCAVGRVIADGIIQVNFSTTYVNFKANGTNDITITSTNTFPSDTLYMLPTESKEIYFQIPLSGSDNDFTVDLTAGDTLYFTISGVK